MTAAQKPVVVNDWGSFSFTPHVSSTPILSRRLDLSLACNAMNDIYVDNSMQYQPVLEACVFLGMKEHSQGMHPAQSMPHQVCLASAEDGMTFL